MFRVDSPGGPNRVQDLLAAEARRRFQAQAAAPGRHGRRGQPPLAGRPDAELQGLASPPRRGRPGGVLVGLFLDRPATRSTARSRLPPCESIAATGRLGGWAIRRLVPTGRARPPRPRARRPRSCSAGPASWSLTAPSWSTPRRSMTRIGPRLGPIRLFADQPTLWEACAGVEPQGPPRFAGDPDLPAWGAHVRAASRKSVSQDEHCDCPRGLLDLTSNTECWRYSLGSRPC